MLRTSPFIIKKKAYFLFFWNGSCTWWCKNPFIFFKGIWKPVMIFLELHYLYDNPINLSSILLFLLGCLFVCPYSSILWRDLSSFVVFYGLVFCMPLYYFKFFFSMKVFFFLKKVFWKFVMIFCIPGVTRISICYWWVYSWGIF